MPTMLIEFTEFTFALIADTVLSQTRSLFRACYPSDEAAHPQSFTRRVGCALTQKTSRLVNCASAALTERAPNICFPSVTSDAFMPYRATSSSPRPCSATHHTRTHTPHTHTHGKARLVAVHTHHTTRRPRVPGHPERERRVAPICHSHHIHTTRRM
jgi:hypothetical protein